MLFAFPSTTLTIIVVSREDRAMLRSNPSARADARTWGVAALPPLLTFAHVWASKAINLIALFSASPPMAEPPWLTYVKISAASALPRAQGSRGLRRRATFFRRSAARKPA